MTDLAECHARDAKVNGIKWDVAGEDDHWNLAKEQQKWMKMFEEKPDVTLSSDVQSVDHPSI